MNRTDDHNAPSKSPDANLRTGLQQFYRTNGLVFGTVDIFCMGSSKPDHRVVALVHTLLGFADPQGHSPIGRFIVVLPATTADSSDGERAIRSQLERLLTASDRAFSEEFPISDRLQIITPPDLRSNTILSIAEAAPPRSVVIIRDAAAFRAEGIQPFIPPGAEIPTLLEDFWVLQLHALSQALTDLLKEREVYAILDAGHLSPYRPALNELLQSIDNVGVVDLPLAASVSGGLEKWITRYRC